MRPCTGGGLLESMRAAQHLHGSSAGKMSGPRGKKNNCGRGFSPEENDFERKGFTVKTSLLRGPLPGGVHLAFGYGWASADRTPELLLPLRLGSSIFCNFLFHIY